MYRYETHAHTAEVSKCSKISAKALARFYKDKGFSGLFVTDHFLNGNTTVGSGPDWEGRIELFCRGFSAARKEGEKIGLDVFFGWEYSFRGTDLLTYGLDKQWLLAHPDLLSYSINDYCALVRQSGGMIVHAHPFREASYIDMIRLLPRDVDAVEVFNSSMADFFNVRAEDYAKNYLLPRTAGSDNHSGEMERLGYIETERKFESASDMIDAVKAGAVTIGSCDGASDPR